MPDQLRVADNERIDRPDFQYNANAALDEAGRHIIQNLVVGPQERWIVHGFKPSNPSAAQLQVDRGAAILSRRDGGTILQGYLTAEGDTSKIVDMVGYSDGTYQVYLRFDLVSGTPESRVFWNPGSDEEFVQTINTRLNATWSMRIEAGTPGAEWFPIAQVVKSGGSIVITDQRQLYFEGLVGTYESDWGSGDDRDGDRDTYGVSDIRRMFAALRKQLEDMIGREGWWSEADDPLNKKSSFLDHWSLGSDYTYGRGATGTSGSPAALDVTLTEGAFYFDGVRVRIAAATVTLPNNSSGYIEARTDGAFHVNTGAQAGARVYQWMTLAGVITLFVDRRTNYTQNYLHPVHGFYVPSGTAVRGSSGNGQGANFQGTTMGAYCVGGEQGIWGFVDEIGNDAYAGVQGSSSGSYGGHFTGGSDRAPLHLAPKSAAPPEEQVGDIYPNNTDGLLRWYNGARWQVLDNPADEVLFAEVQTVGITPPTPLITIYLQNYTVAKIHVTVLADDLPSGFATTQKALHEEFIRTIRTNHAGVSTAVGGTTAVHAAKDDSNWAVSTLVSSNYLRVSVQDSATGGSNIDWRAIVEVTYSKQ